MRVSNKKFFLILAGVLVLAYGIWQARDFLRGPRIYLESPQEGEILRENLLASQTGKPSDGRRFRQRRDGGPVARYGYSADRR